MTTAQKIEGLGLVDFINSVPELAQLPEYIKKEVALHPKRLDFLVCECVSKPEIITKFYEDFKVYQAEMKMDFERYSDHLINFYTFDSKGKRTTSMGAAEFCFFIVFIYRTIYMDIRDHLEKIEQEEQLFNNAVQGRA